MQTIVLETNVLMTASGFAEQADKECAERCIRIVEQLMQGALTLVLDESLLILNEYQKNLSGKPGSLGYQFLRKWLDTHWHKICRVDIKPINSEAGEFEVLQDHRQRLDHFDPSDRKLIAVALAAQAKLKTSVPILNATDSDYCENLSPLKEVGVAIQFLCPELMPNPKECH